MVTEHFTPHDWKEWRRMQALHLMKQEGWKQRDIAVALDVIAPDFRDIRTELKRLGYTVRDIAYDYGYNVKQVNRFLDGKLPTDDPAARQIAVFLKSIVPTN